LALRQWYRTSLQDLGSFALAQFACTAFAVVAAKTVAWYLLQEAPLLATLPRLPSVLAHDLVLLGGAGLLVLTVGRGPTCRWPALRLAGALFVYGGFACWTLLSLVNAAFFMTLGASLNYDLLQLAPDLAQYFLNSVTLDTAGILVVAAILVATPLLLTPSLSRLARGRGARSWGAMLCLLLAGVVLTRHGVANAQEKALRNSTIAFLVLPASLQVSMDTAPPTPEQAALIDSLLGPEDASGRAAFTALPRRPRNVLFVVWESVGERYLRDHHPLGEARTPHLRALAASGSVRFSQAYVETPLSVQSLWSLMTGMSPPAKPQVFLAPGLMPEHGPVLASRLKDAGHRTFLVIGSYTRCWRADRIARLGGGFDLFEDIESLANTANYRHQDWSIDGRALDDRFWSWLDEAPRGQPFFGVIWNVETHYPYRWTSMSAAEAALPVASRYPKSIEHADDLLGEIAEGLRQRQLADDTLLVVIGDHGEGVGRPPHRTELMHGMHVHEDSIHVPLVFLNPALQRETVIGTPARLSDVYPTVIDLLGLAAPPGLDGHSLASPQRARPLLARSIQWWPVAVRAGRYKLVMRDPDDIEGLYDMERDTTESVDLSADHPDIVDALRAYILFETAQRRRFDPTMDMDRRGLFPRVPKPAPPPVGAGRAGL
jgi:arylsulfatase A-like enzyme